MDLFEKQILKSLQRHGKLSQTDLYRYFHRYRARRKNEAVENLVNEGFISKEIKRSSDRARKPTQIFDLTGLGLDYLNKRPDLESNKSKTKTK